MRKKETKKKGRKEKTERYEAEVATMPNCFGCLPRSQRTGPGRQAKHARHGGARPWPARAWLQRHTPLPFRFSGFLVGSCFHVNTA